MGCRMTDDKTRRRWISLGEVIALAALVISGLGLWITWSGSQKDKPTRIVEQKQSIPLVASRLRSSGADVRLHRARRIEPRASVAGPDHSWRFADRSRQSMAGSMPSPSRRRSPTRTAKVPRTCGSKSGALRRSRHGPLIKRQLFTQLPVEGGGLFGGNSVRLTGLSR